MYREKRTRETNIVYRENIDSGGVGGKAGEGFNKFDEVALAFSRTALN